MRNLPSRFTLVALVSLAGVANLIGRPLPAHAAASIHLSHHGLAPGDIEALSGTGFPAGQLLHVTSSVYIRGHLDPSKLYYNASLTRLRASARVAGDGRFLASLELPADTEPGSYRLSVSNTTTALASEQMTVWPLVTLPREASAPVSSSAPQGHFAIRAIGLTPGQTVTFTVNFSLTDGGTSHIVRNLIADSAGRAEEYLQAPGNARPGLTTVTTVQGSIRETAGLIVVSLAGISTNSPTGRSTVVPGESLYVAGTGYRPGEDATVTMTVPIYAHAAFTISRTWMADASGRIQDSLLRVPKNAKRQTIVVKAIGDASKKQALVDASVIYHPSISVTPGVVSVQGSVTASGSGFLASAPVHVAVTGPDSTSATQNLSSDVNGGFSTSVQLPSGSPAGEYTVQATSGVGGLSASARFAATLGPAMTVKPSEVMPGATVALTGSGFSANATVNVSGTFALYGGGSRTITAAAPTDANGRFSTHLLVPGHSAAGTFTITAKGPSAEAVAMLLVDQVQASISLTPSAVVPGGSFIARGSGFPANDTVAIRLPLTMSDGSNPTLTFTAHADSHGRFSQSVQIPSNAAAGRYTVTALSSDSGRAPSARLDVAVHPAISLLPSSIRPGGTVTVSGQGFSSNASLTVDVTFPLYGGGNKSVAMSVHADSQGRLSANLTVPGRAAVGTVTVRVRGANFGSLTARLTVSQPGGRITVSPSVSIPGSSVTLHGSGFLPRSIVDLTATVRLLGGAHRTISSSVTANSSGQFTAKLHLPGDAIGGGYSISAHDRASGRTATARLTIATLAPSIVIAPAITSPGTVASTSGFGFPAKESVTLTSQGIKLATVTTSSSGTFSTTVTIPGSLASGTYSLVATGSDGRRAQVQYQVNRAITTHLYFAAVFTGAGRHQLIDLLNPTQIRERVTIIYLHTNGSQTSKTISVNAHSRYTEDANSDLGTGASTSVEITADGSLVAERTQQLGSSQTVTPAATSPAQTWYFADGNTSSKYREYIAVENPNNHQIQVTFHILPTHHHAFNVYRTMAPTSRTTLGVRGLVHDAVGVIVTADAPVVAERTLFFGSSFSTKTGVSSPGKTWYFAGGSQDAGMHYWIGAINPNGSRSWVTLHAYDPSGNEVATVHGWVAAHGRVGYQINRLTHRTDVSVALTSSQPIVAEQMTYLGNHQALAEVFGVPVPVRTFGFAAAVTTGGFSDALTLFNPSLVPTPVVVQFMTDSGAVTQRTYIVAPLAQLRVDVGSVVPNANLGIMATSDNPFVALNRVTAGNQQIAMVSDGIFA